MLNSDSNFFRKALKLMEEFANKMDQEQIKTVYCFGDNPLSDIYGPICSLNWEGIYLGTITCLSKLVI